jgi:hypothetical protein
MISFTKKQLRVTLILSGANSVFPGTNSNTLIIEGMRMTAKVQAVARLATQADVRIYGMRQADMNALTVAWANPPVVLDHLVIVEANTTGNADGWVQVFKGTIIEAQPDYRGMPDVSFNLLAVTGYFQKINPAEPVSYPNEVDISTVIQDMVAIMGDPWTLVFGDEVEGVLSNPYFYGTMWDQLAQACAAANCDFYIQGDQILITAAGRARGAEPAVVLRADSGLVGYPMFERSGLSVTALFDPAFLCGVALEIVSDVPNATGRWYPYSIFHTLESNMPRGSWMSELKCLRVLA